MNSPVEEIKTRLDIVEFIQTYLRLTKAGVNYRAVCPFHSEKTPSFFVSPTRQIWHCFGGCGDGGDIFKFVMKIEGLDFPEALRLLAGRAGVVLTREDPALRSMRNRLYEACEEAAKIFERNLLLSAAPKEYLKKRGLREETVRGFRIGFAPEGWDFLVLALAKKGVKKEDAAVAGLAIRREDGSSYYDRFRSRIMFPINDANGRVIGFGGRIFEPEAGSWKPEAARAEAKYINTPQTMIYDKSRALYGFDKAKQEIRARNAAVVVEGYMDCVMSHQAGVKNTIAVSGTALTVQQLTILKRLCDTLVSSFDTDAAGETATARSLALTSQFQFERRIAAIPSGKDPADAVLENPALWAAAVAEAKPVVEFYFEKLFREVNPERVEGKKKISAVLIPLIAQLYNEIEKAHWVGALATRFGVGEDAVWKEIASPKKGDSSRIPRGPDTASDSAPAPTSRRDLLEERFLTLRAMIPNETAPQESAWRHLTFRNAINQSLHSFLERPEATVPEEIAAHLETMRFKGEILMQRTQNPAQELFILARELEKECIREELSTLGEEIQAREREGDTGKVASLLEHFRARSEKLKILL